MVFSLFRRALWTMNPLAITAQRLRVLSLAKDKWIGSMLERARLEIAFARIGNEPMTGFNWNYIGRESAKA